MFSDNDRISERQVYRLLVFELIAESTFAFRPDGVVSIVINGVIAGIFLWYIFRVVREMDMDLVSFVDNNLPVWAARGLYLFLGIIFIVAAGYSAYVFVDVMQYGLLAEEYHTVMLIVILALVYYTITGGIESRARVFEVLFSVIFLILLIMLAVAAREVELQYLSELGELTMPDGAVWCLPLFLIIFLPGYVSCKNWKNMRRAIYASLITAVLVTMILYVILVGNFGAKALSTMTYPVIVLLRGTWLDAFMVGIWFFALFALVSACVFYGKEMISCVNEFKKGAAAVVVILVFAAAELFRYGEFRDYYETFMTYLGMPLIAVLPGIILLVGKAVKKR